MTIDPEEYKSASSIATDILDHPFKGQYKNFEDYVWRKHVTDPLKNPDIEAPSKEDFRELIETVRAIRYGNEQLVLDKKKMNVVMDYLVETSEKSMKISSGFVHPESKPNNEGAKVAMAIRELLRSTSNVDDHVMDYVEDAANASATDRYFEAKDHYEAMRIIREKVLGLQGTYGRERGKGEGRG